MRLLRLRRHLRLGVGDRLNAFKRPGHALASVRDRSLRYDIVMYLGR